MTRRQERVESLVLRELSELIQRRVQDPRVRGVHIVNVDISPDFHLARVLYSFLNETGNTRPEDVQNGLDSAKAFLRRELKKKIELRVVPELAFFFDPSIQHGDHLLELLRNIKPSD
ncbi:MAG: 30S ribosome-binding factor RbfA [Candidatus Riflebacteria bacterium]|jgi:ribosome-binding factor A|nr:30S ribosome-binding factor RbfA [Candidatus Riflebacteria bacterium]